MCCATELSHRLLSHCFVCDDCASRAANQAPPPAIPQQGGGGGMLGGLASTIAQGMLLLFQVSSDQCDRMVTDYPWHHSIRLWSLDDGSNTAFVAFVAEPLPCFLLFVCLFIAVLVMMTRILYSWIGMAFGTGSAVAHRAVDAVVGPRTISHEHTQVSDGQGNVSQTQSTTAVAHDACNNQTKAFQDVSLEPPWLVFPPGHMPFHSRSW